MGVFFRYVGDVGFVGPVCFAEILAYAKLCEENIVRSLQESCRNRRNSAAEQNMVFFYNPTVTILLIVLLIINDVLVSVLFKLTVKYF